MIWSRFRIDGGRGIEGEQTSGEGCQIADGVAGRRDSTASAAYVETMSLQTMNFSQFGAPRVLHHNCFS